MDRLTKEQRRKNMQAVKNKNSQIEIALGKALWAKGYRYRKNDTSVIGKPDFTFKRIKLAIFVDGEFWHGKDWEIKKFEHKSNEEFWYKKIEGNIKRDNLVNEYLLNSGWKVLRFWGNDIKKNLVLCIEKIEMEINEKISIEEFNGKKFKIRVVEPNDNKLAVITHYLHNKENELSDYFKKDAFKFVKQYLKVKFPEEEITNKVAENAIDYFLFETENVPFAPPSNPKFKFIDLFAGIGGFRIAMQNLGGKCVYSSEWDEQSQKTYKANFGEVPFGDITKPETKKYIPNDFDVLCAGFPCQAFSIAGKRGGFEDIRGTLFFDVAEIIKTKQPKAFFLENVKGLTNHDKGKTLSTILNVLRNDLNYYVPEPRIMNAKDFGVSQNRERIYIVGFRKDLNINEFEYPKPFEKQTCFADIKEEKVPTTKYYLSTQYLQTLINHKSRHESKGNGFGYAIIKDNEIANAIVVGGMGRERNFC